MWHLGLFASGDAEWEWLRWKNRSMVSRCFDLWNGIVLFFCYAPFSIFKGRNFLCRKILGKPPFDSQTQHETIRMIRSIELTFPSTATSDLRDLITKVNKFLHESLYTINNILFLNNISVTSTKSCWTITVEGGCTARLGIEKCRYCWNRRELC